MAPPVFAVSANPKIYPRTLAGLQCRPLQAKGEIVVKILPPFQNFIVGASIARPLKPCGITSPRVEQSPTPTINRKKLRLNFSAISQFHRRGGAWLRPPLPYQQTSKYSPAPLAGLQCRPLQAKGKIIVKILSLFHNSTVGASIVSRVTWYTIVQRHSIQLTVC